MSYKGGFRTALATLGLQNMHKSASKYSTIEVILKQKSWCRIIFFKSLFQVTFGLHPNQAPFPPDQASLSLQFISLHCISL